MKKLTMVSLGPGDHELITIKALKALQKCDAVCVPTKNKNRSFDKSLTYKLITTLMKEFNFEKPIIPVYAAMEFKQAGWQSQVDAINKGFDTYESLCFVTLGDSAFFSTVYYLLDIFKNRHKELYEHCDVIPGVTSFSSASARVKKPLCLGDSEILITPLLETNLARTTVYMRPKIAYDSSKITQNGKIYTFENLHLHGENILNYKKEKVEKYMTLFIDFAY